MIVGVTCWINGERFDLPKPNRHHNVIRHLVSIGKSGRVRPDGQGFYTDTGEYLGREQAREYALRIGQVTKTDHQRELFSEDLW